MRSRPTFDMGKAAILWGSERRKHPESPPG
jgi:hypothetical protein